MKQTQDESDYFHSPSDTPLAHMGPLYLVLTSSHCNDLFWGCLWNAFDPRVGRGSANSFFFLVGVPEKMG